MDLIKKLLTFLVLVPLIFISGCTQTIEKPNEEEDMGYVEEDVESDEVPPELLGTWEASDGLPQGLESYSLTFGQDNQVTQVSKVEDGEETSDTSRFLVDGTTIKILDPNNTVLMSLDFSDNALSTKDLGDTLTTFVKKL